MSFLRSVEKSRRGGGGAKNGATIIRVKIIRF